MDEVPIDFDDIGILYFCMCGCYVMGEEGGVRWGFICMSVCVCREYNSPMS